MFVLYHKNSDVISYFLLLLLSRLYDDEVIRSGRSAKSFTEHDERATTTKIYDGKVYVLCVSVWQFSVIR